MIKLDKGLKVSGRTGQSAVFCHKDQTTYRIALCDELLPDLNDSQLGRTERQSMKIRHCHNESICCDPAYGHS